MGVSCFSSSVDLAPQGCWDLSGASMQARRTVIFLLPSDTRIVSPSPTETTVAAFTLVVRQAASSSVMPAFIFPAPGYRPRMAAIQLSAKRARIFFAVAVPIPLRPVRSSTVTPSNFSKLVNPASNRTLV